MRISDWSSDVCSSDLPIDLADDHLGIGARPEQLVAERGFVEADCVRELFIIGEVADELRDQRQVGGGGGADGARHGRPVSMGGAARSEERRGGQGGVSTCRFRWTPYH